MNPIRDLRGQSVVVLGATGTLGCRVTEELGQRGADLILTGRQMRRLDDLARAFPKARIVPGDLRRDSTRRLLGEACSFLGKLDGLVVAVGEADYHALASLSDLRTKDVLDINLTLPILLVKDLLPYFLKYKRGSIVLVSSSWGLLPAPGETVYAAAKAGLIGFGRSLAAELLPSNIRVNIVAPHAFPSRMISHLAPADLENLASRQRGSLLDPREVSKVIGALLHPDDPRTGSVLELGGPS